MQLLCSDAWNRKSLWTAEDLTYTKKIFLTYLQYDCKINYKLVLGESAVY